MSEWQPRFTTDQMMSAWAMATTADEDARKMGEFIYEKPWAEIDELKRRELLYCAMANLGFALRQMTKENPESQPEGGKDSECAAAPPRYRR